MEVKLRSHLNSNIAFFAQGQKRILTDLFTIVHNGDNIQKNMFKSPL